MKKFMRSLKRFFRIVFMGCLLAEVIVCIGIAIKFFATPTLSEELGASEAELIDSSYFNIDILNKYKLGEYEDFYLYEQGRSYYLIEEFYDSKKLNCFGKAILPTDSEPLRPIGVTEDLKQIVFENEKQERYAIDIKAYKELSKGTSTLILFKTESLIEIK